MRETISKQSIFCAMLAIGSLFIITAGADLARRQAVSPDTSALAPASERNIRSYRSELALNLSRPAPIEGPQGEGKDLLELRQYWEKRITYPTGQYNPSWLQAAAAQDSQVPRGVPNGRVVYTPPVPGSHTGNLSPLTLNPNQFTSLGPAPEQSTNCYSCYAFGHVAGRVNAIAIDPVTTNVAYIGVVGGGVWKTTNCCSSATTWASTFDDPLISTNDVSKVSIDPNNHNVVYAGTGDLNFVGFPYSAQGILKSADQGATWTVLGASIFSQYQHVGKVRVDPRNSNNVIAGTAGSLYFSYNGGANWTGPCITNPFNSQRQEITGLLVRDNGSGTDLYAAVGDVFSTLNGANGVYKATLPASGCPASWTLLTTDANGWPTGTGNGAPGATKPGRIDLAMAPSNPSYIYAEVESLTTSGLLGVWRTTDGGVTWQQRATASSLPPCSYDPQQNWYNQSLAIDPNNPNVLFLDTYDIWKSTDGGTTFADITCGFAPPYVH